MAICGAISTGSTFNCSNPIVGGVETRLILLNKAVYDRATVTFDVTLTQLITNITLTQSGDVAYAFEGTRTSLTPETAFVPQTVSSGYDHTVNFLVFDISAAQKENLEAMALGKMVAIIQNVNTAGNGDSVFEVLGKDVGLEVQELTRINGDLETNGAFSIQLKSSDDFSKEPHLPSSFWDTDFVTTKAKVDALLVPVV
jgi:hypothetical protein